MASHETDLVVIGGGPGGYVGAIRASQLGAQVTLVEQDDLGGVCLNWGCIPTKTLMRTCEMMCTLREAEELGIDCANCTINLDRLRNRKNRVMSRLVGGVTYLLKKNKVSVVKGRGEIVGPHTVRVTGSQVDELKADHIMLATGSRPAMIPMANLDKSVIWTNRQALELKEIPQRLLVIGAGAIGIEFSHIYHILGSEVTIVEMMSHIVPGEDVDTTELLRKLMVKRGIRILTDSRMQTVEPSGAGGIATVKTPEGTERLEFDKVLVSVGRSPNSQKLGLETVGVDVDKRGFIKVNDRMQTSCPSILAVGDVIGGYLLAHTASREAEVAVENALGMSSALSYAAVPRFVGSIPEIAGVGLTEAQATEQGKQVKIGKFPFSGNGKALVHGEQVGFVKLVSEAKTGELLGMQIIGPHATDLILEGVCAVSNRLKVKDIAEAIHHHPALGEAIREAALDVDKRAIHS